MAGREFQHQSRHTHPKTKIQATPRTHATTHNRRKPSLIAMRGTFSDKCNTLEFLRVPSPRD